MAGSLFGDRVAATPLITTTFTTRTGAIGNLVDGIANLSGWAPQASNTSVVPADAGVIGLKYAGAVPTGSEPTAPAGSVGNGGLRFTWSFSTPTSVGMLRYRASNDCPLGRFILQASQNGTTWVTLGAPFYLGGTPGSGSADILIPFGVPGSMPGGYTVRNGEGDQSGLLYYDTFFYNHFRIEGCGDYITFYPIEGEWTYGGQTITAPNVFEIWSLELGSADQPGTVQQNPDLATWPVLVPNDDTTDITDGSNPADGPFVPGGGVSVPPGDYRHILSHGNRGQPYVPVTHSDQAGSGIVLAHTSTEGSEPPHQYAGVLGGLNNNFGGNTGDGPYFDGPPDGWFIQFDMAYYAKVTGLKIVNDSNVNLALWQLQALNAGVYVPISTGKVLTFPTGTDPYGEHVCTIEADLVPYVTNSIRLVKVSGSTGGGRLATEYLIKIDHSKLEGGDRRTGANAVLVTTTFTNMIDQDDHAITTDSLKCLVDGAAETYNGGNALGMGYASGTPPFVRFNNVLQTAGRYFQFRFPRGVTMKRAAMSLGASGREVYDDDGNPTIAGMWKWQASADGTAFVDVGDPFAWGNQQSTAILESNTETSGVIAGYWRLAIVDDTVLPFDFKMSEITFHLNDVGVATPILFGAGFTDDDGMVIIAPTLSEPDDPFTAIFRDDTTMTATPTLHFVKLIKGQFTDDGVLDIFSELSPSIIAQSTSYQTGR